MEGELIINDIEYDAKMPANFNLTALEIAEILTYVGNSWNNSIGLVSPFEVEKGLQKCD